MSPYHPLRANRQSQLYRALARANDSATATTPVAPKSTGERILGTLRARWASTANSD